MTTISIVTPWLGHPELVEDYVDAVEPELRQGDEVLIVDNGGAPHMRAFRSLTPGFNLGFAEGSNFGLRQAAAEAVLFLNNDIALGRPGWLNEIRQALEPGLLVGPLRHDRHADVDEHPFPYIDGWCLAGMTKDLLALGGFHPDLEEPAYFSDNLLCLEARASGMALREVRVSLRHKENVTAGPALNGDVRAATLANRELYLARARALLAPA